MNVYRSTNQDSGYELIQEYVDGFNYLDKNVKNNVVYYYKVRAIDGIGNIGELSAPIAGTTIKDEQSPLVKVNSNRDTVISSDSLNIGLYAIDDVCLSNVSVSYRIDGRMDSFEKLYEKTDIDSVRFANTIDLSKIDMQNGEKLLISAVATDHSGNVSQKYEKEFDVKISVSAVMGLSIEIDDDENAATITWNGVTGDEANIFRLQISTDGGQTYANVTSIKPDDTGKYVYVDKNLGDDISQLKYKVVAADGFGNSASDVSANKKVSFTSKPIAAIKCIDYGEVNVEYSFDATYMNPSSLNCSYVMDFGDGTIVKKGVAYHKYTNEGTYILTLTATNSKGISSTVQKTIEIKRSELMAKVKILVCDENGSPFSDSYVYIDPEVENRFLKLDNGTQLVDLPIGTHKIIAVAKSNDGTLLKPVTVRKMIYAGDKNEVTIIVEETPAVKINFSTRKMTFDEIQAAKIDISKPENQNIVSMQFNLGYVTDRNQAEFALIKEDWLTTSLGHDQVVEYETKDTKGQFIIPYSAQRVNSTEEPYEDNKEYNAFDDYEFKYESIFKFELPHEITFLKDFYTSTFTAYNLCDREFELIDNKVTLNLPKGLTLINQYQASYEKNITNAYTNEVSFDDIPGGEEHSVNWIFRADSAGYYEVTADYHGEMPLINSIFECQAKNTVNAVDSSSEHRLDINIEYEQQSDENGFIHADVYISNKGTKPYNHIRAQVMGAYMPYACYLVRYVNQEDGETAKRENIKIQYAEYIDELLPNEEICYRYEFKDNFIEFKQFTTEFFEGSGFIANVNFWWRGNGALNKSFDTQIDATVGHRSVPGVFAVKVTDVVTGDIIEGAKVSLTRMKQVDENSYIGYGQAIEAVIDEDGYALFSRKEFSKGMNFAVDHMALTISADGYKRYQNWDYIKCIHYDSDEIQLYSEDEKFEK